MVPSKRLAPETPPETLPEDFSDWDGESSSATLPVASKAFQARDAVPVARERAHTPVATPPPPPPPPAPRPAERHKSGSSRSQAGADSDLEAFLRRLSEVNADQAPARQPETNQATNRWTASAPSQGNATVQQEPVRSPVRPAPVEQELISVFRSGYEAEEDTESDDKKKPNWVMIGVIAAGVVGVGLAIGIPLALRGRSITPPRPAATTTTIVNSEESTSMLKPSPSVPASGTPTTNATGQNPYQGSQQASGSNNDADPTPVSAEMMNQQLTAASQLPQGARNKAPQEAPPPPGGFGVAGMETMGDNGAVGSAFKNQTRIKLSPVTVSAGVAGGLLVRRIAPEYPSIARTARVSGRVVLAASISKSGRVQNLQVVSGPPMLRQAALDAVRNWLYKPYLLNNQPTEVQTTIDVDFNL
jgi:TonB family protein